MARTEADKASRRTAAGPYEVGYGKPPASTRFVKGQSGNAAGRPRKPKPQPPQLSDGLSTRFLEQEAYRPVTLRENGQVIQLSAIQAVQRALFMGAIKGNRLSQKYLLELLPVQEERDRQRKIENYVRLTALKRAGEKTLAEHERKGLPPPDLLPHPEDIVLHPSTDEAYVNGPEVPEEVHLYEHSAQLRDHILLRSAHAYELGKWASPRAENESSCGFLLFAQILDGMLPPRYRWKDLADLNLFMDGRSLTKRERERLIAAEFAQLNATTPRLSSITPVMEWEISRLVSKFRGSRNAPPDGAVAG
jgi:hypothetical protein